MKKFLIIDDHEVVRSGIKGLLIELFKPAEIDESSNGETAIENLKLHQYDLVIMDIQIPKTDTLGLMEHIRNKYPTTKVLVFSMSAENIYAKRFLKAGAKGFLSKDAPLDEIKKAINLVLNNRKYISETLASVLAEESISDTPGNPFNQLSPREFEILSLLLSGRTISEISKLLNLQVSTIGTHKARLLDKLQVTSLLQLKEMATAYNL